MAILIDETRKLSDTEKYAIPEPGKYNFKNVPLNDPRVWSLFARGATLGVFQLEKKLGQDWSKRAKPQNIEELAILVSILRPGCLESGMAESYVKRKHGEEEIEYFHPSLEPILKDTLGLLIFQEQAMRIAVELAGFTEVEADTLRKGIGKKLPEVIAKVKTEFVNKAEKKGIVTREEAEEIFSWIQKFQRYGFNKSHAVSYAMIGYFCAYQKVHFTSQFYASWLTYSDWKPNQKEEIYNLVQDARLVDVVVKPPTIQKKNVDFEVSGEKEITFGLLHIRGVGSAAVDAIKDDSNDFSSFEGLLLAGKRLKRNVVEALVKAGACDCYGIARTQMLRTVQAVFGRKDKDMDETPNIVKKLTDKELRCFCDFLQAGMNVQESLQGIIDTKSCTPRRIAVIKSKIDWLSNTVQDTNKQKSIWETLYLGLNLTCSAADDVAKTEKNTKTCRQAHSARPGDKIVMHVVIDEIKVKKTSEKARNPGQEFAFLCVSDNTAAINNVVIWSEKYDEVKEDINEGDVVTLFVKKDAWKNKENFVVLDLKVIG